WIGTNSHEMCGSVCVICWPQCVLRLLTIIRSKLRSTVMNREPIRAWHLEKLAFVYLRQSSLTQVRRNTEGEERQRRMHDLIRELGWPEEQVVVLRGDTGNSGSSQHGREDYQRMLAAVLADQIG